MNQPIVNSGSRDSVFGGILLSFLSVLQASDIAQAAVLACVGAAVSFATSMTLRYLLR